MSKFNVSVNIPSPPDKLIEVATDFENLTRFVQYLKSVKILEKNNLETTTEEKISFTYHKLSYNIIQKTVTKRINNNLNVFHSGLNKGSCFGSFPISWKCLPFADFL